MKKLPMIGFIIMTALGPVQPIAAFQMEKEWRPDQMINLEELNQKGVEEFSQGRAIA